MATTYTPKLNLPKPSDGDYDWLTPQNQAVDALDTAVGTEHNADGTHKHVHADRVTSGDQVEALANGEIAATRIRLPGGTIDGPQNAVTQSLKNAIDGGASAALNASQPLILTDPSGNRPLFVVDPDKGLSGMLGNIVDPLVRLPLRRAEEITGASAAAGAQYSGTATFTRASTATYIDPLDGLLKTAAIDTPRFERMADGGIGILMEGSSTNRLLWSRDFTQTAWVKANLSVTANAVTGPDGAVSASTLTDNTATGTHAIYQAGVLPAGDQAYYKIVKAGTLTQVVLQIYNATDGNVAQSLFDLSTGSVVSTTAGSVRVIPLANGWYWCEVSGVGTATSDVHMYLVSGGGSSYTGTGTGTVHVWHAQAENLPFGSSPILTTSAAVTRAADMRPAIQTSGNVPYITDEFTAVLDVEVIGNPGTMYLLMTWTDWSGLGQNGMRGIRLTSGMSGVAEMDSVGIPITAMQNTVERWAIRYNPATNVFDVWKNGVQQGTRTIPGTNTDQPIPTNVYIGGYQSTAGQGMLRVRNARIYDRALTDAEVAAA